MRKRWTPPCVGVSALAAWTIALSATATEAQQTWRPTRVDQAPVIDGVLDDAAWQQAPRVEGFRTWEPDYGQEMVGDTHVYMAYDDDNLYFAFLALDPEPGLIKASVTSRDNIYQDDWVAINLDSFGDAQSLYAFYINPLGIQGDSRFANGTEDRGVDVVWYSAGSIHDRGYAAEVQIPLQSIRFNEGDPVKMGVIFERRISRSSQWGTIPELDPQLAGQWLNQMHPLEYADVSMPRVAELLPAVTYTLDKAAPAGVLTTEVDRGDFSLTGKLGLTSDLVLDATYNPDFSQVEADAGQVDVNLRTALFFPEKRPFFLEGREHFGLAATRGANPVQSVVYTRQIADPIAGTRISGKIGDNHTVASIFAIDEVVPTTPGGSEYAQVPILRYKGALSDDSYLGGVYAGRETDERSNRLAGADGQYRVAQSAMLGFHALLSRTRNGPLADALDGHSVAGRLNYSTRSLDWSAEALNISEQYASDVGFFTRSGLSRFGGTVQPKFYPSTDWIRRIDVALSAFATRDHPSDMWESQTQLALTNRLFGSLNLVGTFFHGTEIFLAEEFGTSGFRVALGGLMGTKGRFNVAYSRRDQPFYAAEPYQGWNRNFSTTLLLQPSRQIRAEANLTAVDFFREATGEQVFDYTILRGLLTYQPNRYLFVRSIAEYNSFREELLTDFLVSFTYIPGTVLHVGYGSLYDRVEWAQDRYVPADDFFETKRRLFFKTSYLFRS